MDEERAYEIAFRIRDEFEDLLEKKNITIPSADREGVPSEARLYGEENSRLVEAIAGLLVKFANGITLEGDMDDACHPLRKLAILACDEFEELLGDKNIMVNTADREGGEEEACLYGSEYYALEDSVVDILMEELGAATRDEQTAAISVEARTAVARMQKAMATTPVEAATIGSTSTGTQDAPARPKATRSLAGRSR